MFIVHKKKWKKKINDQLDFLTFCIKILRKHSADAVQCSARWLHSRDKTKLFLMWRQLMYFLIVLFSHFLRSQTEWKHYFCLEKTSVWTSDERLEPKISVSQWTNKYQPTERKRKLWRLCSGSFTKTSESITILQILQIQEIIL